MERRIGLLIDRGGRVFCVCLGDAQRVDIPDITFDRTSPTRLRGLRFVHTDLGSAELASHELVDLARFRLDLTLRVHVAEDGAPLSFSLAHLVPPQRGRPEGERPWHVEPVRAIHGLPGDFAAFISALEDEYGRAASEVVVDGLAGDGRSGDGRAVSERALLVGVGTGASVAELDSRMAELAELASAAGVVVCGSVVQRRERLDPRTLVGRGKLDQIMLMALQEQASVLIFDRDLSPAQARAISARLDLKIIDRTMLILDIFAQRAQSSGGKLQVELARLRYLMPHLIGGGRALSRIRGGIGGNRGVGEQKLELDRRRFRNRIHTLERRLEGLGRSREENRKARKRHIPRQGVPVVALVGYTNAGKSTWMRALSGAEVLVADQLFATLDTTSRRIERPGGGAFLLSDTVGFLRDLPEGLVASFRATLDELADASLLVHVADASDDEVFERIAAVRRILADLELAHIPCVLVLNKADRIDREAFTPLLADEADAILLSARDPDDHSRLLAELDRRLAGVAVG
jgi:GTP-binding protein HflX